MTGGSLGVFFWEGDRTARLLGAKISRATAGSHRTGRKQKKNTFAKRCTCAGGVRKHPAVKLGIKDPKIKR